MWQLFEYVAYVFATKKLRLTTIESHLSAVKCFHRISCGFELDITHLVLTSAFKGAACSHADVGSQPAVRRPVSWAMLIEDETSMPAWRTRGRVLCVALCASLCFLIGASEVFPQTRSRIHETYCLRQADVVFSCGNCELTEA